MRWLFCNILLLTLYHVHTQEKRKQWSLYKPNHKEVRSSCFLNSYILKRWKKKKHLFFEIDLLKFCCCCYFFLSIEWFCFAILYFVFFFFQMQMYKFSHIQQWLGLQNSEHLWITINFKVIYECSEALKIRPILSSFYIWIKLIKHFSFSRKFLYWTVQFK